MHDLPRVVAETAVGKVVPLKVLRDGRQEVVSITLGRLKTATASAKPVAMLRRCRRRPRPPRKHWMTCSVSTSSRSTR